jgi:hypothetical protein
MILLAKVRDAGRGIGGAERHLLRSPLAKSGFHGRFRRGAVTELDLVEV